MVLGLGHAEVGDVWVVGFARHFDNLVVGVDVQMKIVLILILVVSSLILAGCTNYNPESVCEYYCDGSFMSESFSLLDGNTYITCTSGVGNNLSRFETGGQVVMCK